MAFGPWFSVYPGPLVPAFILRPLEGCVEFLRAARLRLSTGVTDFKRIWVVSLLSHRNDNRTDVYTYKTSLKADKEVGG